MNAEPLEPDPEAINTMREEFRIQLAHLDMKELLLETAVNARITTRVVYRILMPRLVRVEQRRAVDRGILISLSIILPLLVTFLKFV